ncbi:hypothetical protein B0H14DRAFT_2610529 [Mycena olivaceomarginata]|nr:hypothetical protein B0H14DRAFT_2610529 [Mycena olivaceomarginata]
MTPISITVTDAADAELHGKRKDNNEQAESLRPAKRTHKTENGGVMRKIKGREQRSQGSFDRENGEAAVYPDIMMPNSYQIKRTKQQTLTADPERVESEQELERCDRICRDMDAVLEISGAVEQYRFGCGDAVKR